MHKSQSGLQRFISCSHYTFIVTVCSSCDPAVLPFEPRLTKKHLSGTSPVIVAEGQKDTGQAKCWLLKLLPRSNTFQAMFYLPAHVTWPLLS